MLQSLNFLNIMLALKIFQILKNFGFGVFDLYEKALPQLNITYV
jgi:hypothetical protein